MEEKDKNETKQSVFTKETFGVVTVLFATLCLVCLITRDAVFYTPGSWINSFLFGVFGYFAFPITVFAIFMGILLVTGKKTRVSGKTKLIVTITAVVLAMLLQVISLPKGGRTYGEYIEASYLAAENGLNGSTAGGALAAIIVYPFLALLSDVGSYVIIGLGLVACVYFLVKNFLPLRSGKTPKKQSFNSSYVQEEQEDFGDIEISGEKEYPADDAFFTAERKPAQRLFVNNAGDFSFKTKREMAKGEDEPIKIMSDKTAGGLKLGVTESYSEHSNEELKKKIDYIKTPATINLGGDSVTGGYNRPNENRGIKVSDYVKPAAPMGDATGSLTASAESQKRVSPEIPFYEHDGGRGGDAKSRAQSFSDRYTGISDDKVANVENATEAPVQKNSVGDSSNVSERAENARTAPQTSAGGTESIRSRGEIFDAPRERPSENNINTEENDFTGRRERGVRSELFGEREITNRGEESVTPAGDGNADELPRSNVIESGARSGLFESRVTEAKDEAVGESERERTERASAAFTSRVAADGNGRSRVFGTPGDENAKSLTSETEKEEKPEKPKPPINRKYFRPPIDLLENYAASVSAPPEDHQTRMEIIKQTLADFHINAEPQSYVQGPTVTRYEVMMPAGVTVRKVLSYDDDLRMRLSSKSGVRIEAPIPGKNLVGVEVANKTKITVGLREVLEGAASKPVKPGALTFAIGKDIVGNAITDNLAKAPHLLVAGATGSGKSVALNVMIVSLIMRYSPEELRLILIDPKRVGFSNYEHIPHLMIDEIITEPQKAVAALLWLYNEMERRYEEFRKYGGISDIEAYNERIASDTVPKIPRIVVVVDELADLMETCKKDMEIRIRSLAAKARAAGIHLVLATQRPSVDVITGTIKANLPSRMALRVMNYADSSTILSEGGAEKLLGNGDMLYKNGSMAECERYQGAWISDREIISVVDYIKEHNAAYFDDELAEFLTKSVKPKQEEAVSDADEGASGGEVDAFFLKALWLAVTSGTVSISQLQRRFQIGYGRAGGLVDKMERMGFITANEGSKARKVLLTREEFEDRFGPMSDGI